MSFESRTYRRRTVSRSVLIGAVAVAITLALALIPVSSSADPSLGELQSQLNAEQGHQQSLSASINALSGLISSLNGQISLVETREAAVRADLTRDRAALAAVEASLAREQHLLAVLRARLARARMLLGRQLVSNYEQAAPNLVSVVIESDGFNDLLDRLAFLHDAQHQQQTIISITRQAKAQADAAAARLAVLQANDKQMTLATSQRVAALANMNVLLNAKQDALSRARSAQQGALAASQAKGSELQAEIGRIQAAEAAAQRAAEAQQVTGGGGGGGGSYGSPTPDGPSYGAGGGWAIPYSVVDCESGGQDLTPNSAGASGYYQIIPSSWDGYGGYSQAYQAPKSLQDQRAAQLWNSGAGAGNWVCSGIVGIH
jgi:septal ring factor EnvC (AmiA/AmiB activator)